MRWFWRAWPFLIVFGIAFLHYLVVRFGLVRIDQVNAEVALITQILGGFLVLYSIDSNAGLFRKRTLGQMFFGWLGEHPWMPREPVNLEGNMAVSEAGADSAAIRGYINPETLEEKVDHLIRWVKCIEEDLSNHRMDTLCQIEDTRKNLQQQITKASNEISSVNEKIKALAFDGIKVQFFGVNLLVYGAFSGYFA